MMEENKTLDIDSFGEIMDKFIEDNHIQMIIDIPEGTNEVEVKDNTGLGPVIQFYIMLQTMCPIYKAMHDMILDHDKHEDFIDSILELVKRDLMEAVKE